MMRLYFIDNLRNMCILILIPYHTILMYNAFGFQFLLQGQESIPLSLIMFAINPWIMALMFILAGASSRYSLVKRSPSVYIKERVLRIFIPFVSGMVFLIPFQTYVYNVWYLGYSEGFFAYLAQYPKELIQNFYTGQLWFLIFLFIISIAAVPIMYYHTKSKKPSIAEKIPLWALCLLFIVPYLMLPLGSWGGDMSLGRYFVYFLIGFLIISSERVQDKLVKRRMPILIAALIPLAIHMTIMLYTIMLRSADGNLFGPLETVVSSLSPYNLLFSEAAAMLCSLALIGFGKRFLESHNRITDYLSESSFTVYVFHQSWLAVIALLLFSLTDNMIIQIAAIIALTFTATYLSYEAVKRFKVTRFLFGIK